MEITAKFLTQDTSFVSVTILDDSGMAEKKTISYEDFCNILNSSVIHSDMLRLGILPKGYYDGYVSKTNRGTFRVLVSVPAEKRLLNYYGENFEVPFPELLFSFEAENGKITGSYVFAVADVLTPDAVLYHYPYGNVYADGHICWGSNILDMVTQMADVDRLVALFFGSETNDDLFVSSECSGQRELICKVSKLESFPKNYLTKSDKKVCNLLIEQEILF